MSSGIFYTTRSVGGREGKNIIHHMSVLQSQCDAIDLLTTAKTLAGKKLIEENAHISINQQQNLYGDYYVSEAKSMPSWKAVYDDIDVTPLKAYDNLYLIGGMDLWRSNLTRTSKRVGVFPNDSGQLKFESVGTHCCNILALLKAHREYGIPLHELAFDPNEMAIGLFNSEVGVNDNYYLYHGYDIPAYDINRLDSLQYYFSNLPVSLFQEEQDKIYDFTFGYSMMERSGREGFVEYINSLACQFKTANVYVKNALTGEDTTLDRDAYLTKLKQSRFTFMLPSYDNHCFSIYRFIEAIHNDCLPLIHPSCNIVDISRSYGIDLAPLTVANIMSEAQRLDILESLKKSVLPFKEGFRNKETPHD